MKDLPCKVFVVVTCVSMVSQASFSERFNAAQNEPVVHTEEDGQTLSDLQTAFDGLGNRIGELEKKRLTSQGYTALANRIVQIEEEAGREKPLRLRLDICEAPGSYPIQEGRLLVKCIERTDVACLDINSKSNGFGKDEFNKLESLVKGACFGFNDVQCNVLKKII